MGNCDALQFAHQQRTRSQNEKTKSTTPFIFSVPFIITPLIHSKRFYTGLTGTDAPFPNTGARAGPAIFSPSHSIHRDQLWLQQPEKGCHSKTVIWRHFG
jgi:hypothetical protein